MTFPGCPPAREGRNVETVPLCANSRDCPGRCPELEEDVFQVGGYEILVPGARRSTACAVT